jgi:plastocyanin
LTRRNDGPTRRTVLAGGILLATPALWRPAWAAQAGVVEVRMKSDPLGAHVMFDPVGVLVEPGATIRWLLEANVHTATAYYPDNDRPLRIPEGAAPWDSGYLVDPGAAFEVTLTVEGVYDYFCQPHEAARHGRAHRRRAAFRAWSRAARRRYSRGRAGRSRRSSAFWQREACAPGETRSKEALKEGMR